MAGSLETLTLRLEELAANKLSESSLEAHVQNTLTANKRYKLEVIQLRTHLGKLAGHIRLLQDNIVGKNPTPTFLTPLEMRNPPSQLTPSLNKQLNVFKRGLKPASEKL